MTFEQLLIPKIKIKYEIYLFIKNSFVQTDFPFSLK